MIAICKHTEDGGIGIGLRVGGRGRGKGGVGVGLRVIASILRMGGVGWGGGRDRTEGGGTCAFSWSNGRTIEKQQIFHSSNHNWSHF